MYIPPESRNESLVLDCYEPEVANKLKELLRPGMTFCDVGANMGVFTLYAARLVGPKGRVYAFEPVPDNLRVLQRNVARNKMEWVTLIPKAISQRPGKSQIYLSNYCGSHSLVPDPAEATGAALTVETIRLDAIPEMRVLDVIKIDTEGTELDVLRSLGEIRVSHVILECATDRLNASGTTPAEFLAQVKEMGYEIVLNLNDPAQGTARLLANQPGSWGNLYLRSMA